MNDMKTQIQKQENVSHTIQTKTKAANQASMEQVLQKYRDKTIQREAAPNNTGLPDNLKSGIENLSGYSMDDVRVHYNSPKPAQLQALAYTQGTDIHVAPGQEKHLPHEAWHVVQQKQGRVHPTMQLQGVNVNDNEGLEHEADVMGGEAMQRKEKPIVSNSKLVQRQKVEGNEGRTHIHKEGRRYHLKYGKYCREDFDQHNASSIENILQLLEDKPYKSDQSGCEACRKYLNKLLGK
jgi:hypothetical protein